MSAENIGRKLASIRRILSIDEIPGADNIQVATVDGWKVVVKRGEFEVSQLAIYIEIDSFVPNSIAGFLTKPGHEPREYGGILGERLRTVRLRKQISQGLLLPVGNLIAFEDGADVTELLGIQKWEAPVSAHLAGNARGNWPDFLRKTDQERVQNLPEIFSEAGLSERYEATIKLDGSSMQVWFRGGEWGVCSRNVDLKMDQDGNAFVDVASRIFTDSRFEHLRESGDISIQGELMGPKIQGNREGLTQHEFFVYDIWDIAEQKHWPPATVTAWCNAHALNHVPFLYSKVCQPLDFYGDTMTALLGLASNTQSMYNAVAEGIVFKREDGQFSFKAISNKYLLSGGE